MPPRSHGKGRALGPFHKGVQQAQASPPKVVRRNEHGFGLWYALMFFPVTLKEKPAAARFCHQKESQTLFLPVLNIKAHCSTPHYNFVLFDALGRATCVDPVCLNLDVPVSTIYCKKTL